MSSKRTIAASNETAILSKVVRPVYFARLDFSSGVERYHTEIGPITATHPIHGAEVYTGIGDFGGIEGDVKESVDGVNQTVKLMISGVKASLINLAITDNFFMRDAELMLGLLDENGALVADPEILYSGFMSKVDIALDAGIGQMALTTESRAIKLNASSDWRFTDEDKQIEVNGDLMGEYIYRMQDLQLVWGGDALRVDFGGRRRRGNPNRGGRGSSDMRLKENVRIVGDIGGICICTWRWNHRAHELGLYGSDFGVVAQQAIDVVPEAVFLGEDGYYWVDYDIIQKHCNNLVGHG